MRRCPGFILLAVLLVMSPTSMLGAQGCVQKVCSSAAMQGAHDCCPPAPASVIAGCCDQTPAPVLQTAPSSEHVAQAVVLACAVIADTPTVSFAAPSLAALSLPLGPTVSGRILRI